MDVSGSFDCKDHADVLLILRLAGSDSSCSESIPANSSFQAPQNLTSQPEAKFIKSFYTHSVVLASSSQSDLGYFRLRLRTQWGKDAEDGGKPAAASAPAAAGLAAGVDRAGGDLAPPCNARGFPLWSLLETVETEAEAEAAVLVLRTIYGHRVPLTCTPLLLLQALQVAHRWDATLCLEELSDQLTKAGRRPCPLNMSMDCLHLLYGGLPPGLRESDDLKDVLHLGQRCLASRFGNLSEVLQKAELHQEFLSLPHAAVVAWAGSDDLAAASENEVVVLLQQWLSSSEHLPCTQPEELHKLACCLRVCQVSPAFLNWVLPRLEWLRGPEGGGDLVRLLPLVGQFKQASRTTGGRSGDGGTLILSGHPEMPMSWVRPRSVDCASPEMPQEERRRGYWRPSNRRGRSRSRSRSRSPLWGRYNGYYRSRSRSHSYSPERTLYPSAPRTTDRPGQSFEWLLTGDMLHMLDTGQEVSSTGWMFKGFCLHMRVRASLHASGGGAVGVFLLVELPGCLDREPRTCSVLLHAEVMIQGEHSRGAATSFFSVNVLTPVMEPQGEAEAVCWEGGRGQSASSALRASPTSGVRLRAHLIALE